MSRSAKINDSNSLVTIGSRADRYWKEEGLMPYYKKLRPKLALPRDLRGKNNLDFVIQKFHLSGIGFGNWVTIEDRHNYVNALIIAMYDLNKVLKFGYNMGFDRLAITFGARGVPRALAHYEPGSKIINISRYERGPFPKEIRFLATGGIGSFAHEYGHFLDYFAGQYLDHGKTQFALTGGRSTTKKRLEESGPLRTITDDILEKLIWKEYGKKHSTFYARLLRTIEQVKGTGEYFIRRNEIFARSFEVFVKMELDKLGIKNRFLTDKKYNPAIYPKESEMKTVVPLFRKLVKGVKGKV